MLKAIFNETEAQEVLAIVNKKIASIFLTDPKPVKFEFLAHIGVKKQGYKTKECVGMCIHGGGENIIQLKIYPGWQNTAIHELAHLYNPGGSEKRTEKVANDIIKYLKRLDNRAYKCYSDYSEVKP